MWGDRKKKRELRKAAARLELPNLRLTPKFEKVTEAARFATISMRELSWSFEVAASADIIRMLIGIPAIAEFGNPEYTRRYERNLLTVGTPIYDIFRLKQELAHAEARFPHSPQEFWASIL